MCIFPFIKKEKVVHEALQNAVWLFCADSLLSWIGKEELLLEKALNFLPIEFCLHFASSFPLPCRLLAAIKWQYDSLCHQHFHTHTSSVAFWLSKSLCSALSQRTESSAVWKLKICNLTFLWTTIVMENKSHFTSYCKCICFSSVGLGITYQYSYRYQF